MKHFLTPRSVAVLMGMALLLLAIPAAVSADSPHFNKASAQLSGFSLVVSFTEAGLGNNQTINYLASADATAVYACFNGGGNHPKATNKATVSGPITAPGTFSSGKNGSISNSLTLSPPGPGGFSCPSGQTMSLTSVSYTNVAITDTTNNVTEPIPGTFTK